MHNKNNKKDTSSTLAVRSKVSADYQLLTSKKLIQKNEVSFMYQQGIKMGKTKYPYVEARLQDSSENLAKRWFVVYKITDATLGELVKKRVEVVGNSVEERMLNAENIIKMVNAILKDGGVVNPLPVARPEGPLTVKVGCEKFMADCMNTTSPNTVRTYKTHLKCFRELLDADEKLMKEVRFEEIQEVMDRLSAKKVSNKYRNSMLVTVKTCFSFFVTRKKLKENPVIGMKMLPVTRQGFRAYTPEQASMISKYLEETGQHQLLFFVKCIYFLLARPHEEIRFLRVKNLLPETVEFRAEHTKSNQTAYVEIPPPLEHLFSVHKVRFSPSEYYIFSDNQRPGPRLLGPKYLYKRYVKAMKVLGLYGMGYDLYSWKHTGAIAYWRATRDIEGLMKQCRHADIAQTVGYLADLGQIVTQTKINQFPDF